jgi:hypothetical protein
MIAGYADDWKTHTSRVNLSIQRELTRNLTFDVGWVGNHALHLQVTIRSTTSTFRKTAFWQPSMLCGRAQITFR